MTRLRALSLACLLAFFALALAPIVGTSPTFDEPFAILRGYAAIRTGKLVAIGHPPLMHYLSAAGVLLEPNLPDPTQLHGWQANEYDDASNDLLWQRGMNVTRLLFLARFPILLVGLLGIALCVRWAGKLFGTQAALVAALLGAFSPNWLAHSAVATTDVPVATAYLAVLYAADRFWRVPGWRNALVCGGLLGAAFSIKFNAFLLLPVLGALWLLPAPGLAMPWQASGRAHFWQKARFGGVMPLAALTVMWAVYRFAIFPYPLAEYLGEFLHFLHLAGGGHMAYLLGMLSDKGWWFYHPLVLLFKTPIALLILWAIALGWLANRNWRSLHQQAPLLLGAGGYLFVTLFSSLNVGYRYLLPALLPLHLLALNAWQAGRGLRAWQVGKRLLAMGYLTAALWSAPHFLAYFNLLAGGSGNGYRILADSNLDWGQDLPALAGYLKTHPLRNGQKLFLSSFGFADPQYYGISAEPLPDWPPPVSHDFVMANPAPGLYAISASNLVGVQLLVPNSFGYFRDKPPLTVLNHTIFLYEVAETPSVQALAQCNPAQVNAPQAMLGIAPGRQWHYDCENSFLQPASPALTVFEAQKTPLANLGEPTFGWRNLDGTIRFQLFASSAAQWENAAFGGDAHLQLQAQKITNKDVTLAWQILQPPPPPVSIFAHLLNADGTLAGAYDALGVPAELWQAGDTLWQRHLFDPAPLAGNYRLLVGMYSLADGSRYFELDLGLVEISAPASR